MASLKRSNSFTSPPPGYHEHGNIELNALRQQPDNIKFHPTGSIMHSSRGYRDYEPNAPHAPDKQLDCNDRMVFRMKQTCKTKVVPLWYMWLLYGLIILLATLLAVAVGMLVAHKWLDVRAALVVNGATLDGNVLWVSREGISATNTPPAAVSPSLTAATVTKIQTTTLSPSSTSSTTSTRKVVTVSSYYTVAQPGTTVIVSKAADASPASPASAGSQVTTSDPGKTVVVVTPSRSIVTSVTLLTTTIPQITPPAVTSTLILGSPNGSH